MKRICNIYSGILILVFAALLASCSKMDDTYKEFLKGGEIVYIGKADSAKADPGRNRIQLSWLILADPKVTGAKIYWNSRLDSLVIPIKKTADIDTIRVMLNGLAEGTYIFEIYTFDDKKNSSMMTEVVGAVYGDMYESALLTRPLTEASFKLGNTNLRFGATNEQAVFSEVEFTDNENVVQKVRVPTDSLTFKLRNYKQGSSLRYRTAFIPAPTAIDTFYTAYDTVIPVEGVLEKVPYSKSTWSVAAFSSEEPNNTRLASKLIDGDINTFWIARYSSNPTSYPNHYVTIDMAALRPVDGFSMVQKTGDRKIRKLEIFVSDDNSNWRSAGQFELQNVERTEQFFTLPATTTFRYFKIVPISGWDSQAQPGLAEISAFRLE